MTSTVENGNGLVGSMEDLLNGLMGEPEIQDRTRTFWIHCTCSEHGSPHATDVDEVDSENNNERPDHAPEPEPEPEFVPLRTVTAFVEETFVTRLEMTTRGQIVDIVPGFSHTTILRFMPGGPTPQNMLLGPQPAEEEESPSDVSLTRVNDDTVVIDDIDPDVLNLHAECWSETESDSAPDKSVTVPVSDDTRNEPVAIPPLTAVVNQPSGQSWADEPWAPADFVLERTPGRGAGNTRTRAQRGRTVARGRGASRHQYRPNGATDRGGNGRSSLRRRPIRTFYQPAELGGWRPAMRTPPPLIRDRERGFRPAGYSPGSSNTAKTSSSLSPTTVNTSPRGMNVSVEFDCYNQDTWPESLRKLAVEYQDRGMKEIIRKNHDVLHWDGTTRYRVSVKRNGNIHVVKCKPKGENSPSDGKGRSSTRK